MNKASILVVDDEPQIRRVLQATLSSNGYDVVEAKNGDEAIRSRSRASRPDSIGREYAGHDRFRSLQQDSNVVRWPDHHGNGPR
jgi:PleD family two-component response regulator